MTVRLTYQIAIVFCVVAIASISEGADSPTSKRVQVFRCEIDGKVTYSDTACERAADKTKVQTALHNTYKPDPVLQKDPVFEDDFAAETSPGSAGQKLNAPPSAKEKQESIAEEQARQKLKCQKINADLDNAKKTYYESHYEDAFGNVHSSDRKKDDKAIARLESERKNNRCRY